MSSIWHPFTQHGLRLGVEASLRRVASAVSTVAEEPFQPASTVTLRSAATAVKEFERSCGVAAIDSEPTRRADAPDGDLSPGRSQMVLPRPTTCAGQSCWVGAAPR